MLEHLGRYFGSAWIEFFRLRIKAKVFEFKGLSRGTVSDWCQKIINVINLAIVDHIYQIIGFEFCKISWSSNANSGDAKNDHSFDTDRSLVFGDLRVLLDLIG